MADLGALSTDRAVRGIERRLREIYGEAAKDIDRKLADFNARFKAKDAIYKQQVKDGVITKADYDAWLRGQVFQGKQWQAKKEQITNTLYHANEQAAKIVNGQMTNVFMANANWQSYQLEHGTGINFGFGLYDSATVARMVKDDPKLLPEWKINERKDYTWNAKKVNTQITQGIIQGEGLAKIADRLSENLCSQNKSRMLTFARTAMTGAQNAGRQVQLEAARDKGIKLHKEWMATLDGHTRDAHRDLDGQKVPIDEPFRVDGMEIDYPGDPNADPSLVYNCRCTMVADVDDYPSEYKRYDNIDGKPIENMTYREWEEAKSGQKAEPSVAQKQGGDILGKLDLKVEQDIDVELFNFFDIRFYKYAYELAQDAQEYGLDDNLVLSLTSGRNKAYAVLDEESGSLEGLFSTGGGTGTNLLIKVMEYQESKGEGLFWLADNPKSVEYYNALGLRSFGDGDKNQMLYTVDAGDIEGVIKKLKGRKK